MAEFMRATKIVALDHENVDRFSVKQLFINMVISAVC